MSRRLSIIIGQQAALAAPSAPELLRRVRDLERENARLRAQLAAAPASLQRVNETRQAASERLREAIAAAVGREADPEAVSAKVILRALEREGFEPLPSERTVLRHLTDLRGHGRTPRGDHGD